MMMKLIMILMIMVLIVMMTEMVGRIVVKGNRATGVEIKRGGGTEIISGGEVIVTSGAIGSPPALINAITDAIGVKDLAMPATAERVWRALRSRA